MSDFKPIRAGLPLRIDINLIKWLRDQADKENRSLNNYIETQLFKLKKSTSK